MFGIFLGSDNSFVLFKVEKHYSIIFDKAITLTLWNLVSHVERGAHVKGVGKQST